MVASARAAALSRIFSRVEEQAQAWRCGHQPAALRETRCCRSARASTVCVPRRSCVTRAADRRTSAARGLACRHACMQTGWRSRPRHPSAGPGVKTGAPRVRVPPDAAGPRVNAHQGSPAINDSFDGVQKRSRAGIDNLYKALSRGLTLIITLTNFFPRASAVGRGAGLEWRSCGWARGGRGLGGAAGDARRAAGTERCSARPAARASARSGPDLVETRPKLLRWWCVASRRF